MDTSPGPLWNGSACSSGGALSMIATTSLGVPPPATIGPAFRRQRMPIAAGVNSAGAELLS
jgi:hypothetical protein